MQENCEPTPSACAVRIRTGERTRAATYHGGELDRPYVPLDVNVRNRTTSECNNQRIYCTSETEEATSQQQQHHHQQSNRDDRQRVASDNHRDHQHHLHCQHHHSHRMDGSRSHLHRSRSLTELKYRRANVVGLVGTIKTTSTGSRRAASGGAAIRRAPAQDDSSPTIIVDMDSRKIQSPFEGEEDSWWSTEVPCVSHASQDQAADQSSMSSSSSSSTGSAAGFGSYTRQQKCTLICLALIHFGVYLSMSIIAPFFPIEAQSKGMSLSVTGWIFSSYALIMFLVSPFMGKIISTFGVKFTLITGLFIASGCNILFGTLSFIDDNTLFTTLCFVLRSVEAMGATAFFTAAWTIIAETFPDDISYVFGIMETFVGLGMTAGPAIGGGLYAVGGYELPFYSLGSFMMATVPVCMYILPDPQIKDAANDDNQSSMSTLIKLYKLPGMMTICLAVLVLCGIWGFLDPTLEPHLRDFGVTPQTAGFLFLFMAATYSVTCPVVGRISDKWGCELTMMFLGLILTAVCLVMMGPSILLPFIPSELRWNVLSLILLGVTIGIGTIPTFQLMLDEAYRGGFEENPATYGMVSSVFSAASSLGEFLGPAVGGVLFEYYSFDMACSCIGIVSVATASILVISTICSHCKLGDSSSGRWSVRSLRWIKNYSNDASIASTSDSGVFDTNERTPLLSAKV